MREGIHGTQSLPRAVMSDERMLTDTGLPSSTAFDWAATCI